MFNSNQVVKKRSDMRFPQFPGMRFIIEENELTTPVGIRLSGSQAITAAQASQFQLLEQFRLSCAIR